MNKNASNLYPFAIQDQLSNGLTGQTPSVFLRQDNGSFSAASGSVTEVDSTNYPGLYQITLTAAECNCNVLTIAVSLPDGQEPVILDVVYPVTMGGATPAEIWQYAGGRTVTNAIPSASDNAAAVWGAQTKEVTIATAQADTFATASAVANIATTAGAIKANTDNLPTSPAAVGSAMTLTEATVSTLRNNLATISTIEAAVVSLSSGLDTLAGHGDTYWSTANVSGLATTAGLESLATYGDNHWATADVSGLATSSELGTAETNIVSAMPDISGLPTAADIWEYTDRTLTEEISVEISSENIADITESVWNADDRTLTDLTPKPNMKNIACTPSNVINAYGVPRLENWTNETAGTQAFDDKINTYITLAKEKMATDLNNHINAAIAYIGADNITELCAWLTGYNLYQDDESTDTDSLPETRYNQYLEQIHRIMENI